MDDPDPDEIIPIWDNEASETLEAIEERSKSWHPDDQAEFAIARNKLPGRILSEPLKGYEQTETEDGNRIRVRVLNPLWCEYVYSERARSVTFKRFIEYVAEYNYY